MQTPTISRARRRARRVREAHHQRSARSPPRHLGAGSARRLARGVARQRSTFVGSAKAVRSMCQLQHPVRPEQAGLQAVTRLTSQHFVQRDAFASHMPHSRKRARLAACPLIQLLCTSTGGFSDCARRHAGLSHHAGAERVRRADHALLICVCLGFEPLTGVLGVAVAVGEERARQQRDAQPPLPLRGGEGVVEVRLPSTGSRHQRSAGAGSGAGWRQWRRQRQPLRGGGGVAADGSPGSSCPRRARRRAPPSRRRARASPRRRAQRRGRRTVSRCRWSSASECRGNSSGRTPSAPRRAPARRPTRAPAAAPPPRRMSPPRPPIARGWAGRGRAPRPRRCPSRARQGCAGTGSSRVSCRVRGAPSAGLSLRSACPMPSTQRSMRGTANMSRVQPRLR